MNEVSAETAVPLPPRELVARVFTGGDPDPFASMERHGAGLRELVRSVLPLGWRFAGKRVLDFGCGPGTVLRHFRAEAADAEFVGCDIHEPSVAWLQSTLSPPMRFLVNGEAPPLDLPSGYFDLILAISVFGHITDHWSAWLTELHRLLSDGGLMVVTLMGEGMSGPVAGRQLSEDSIGMNVYSYGAGFDNDGQGPMVLHSPWWIENHWGRIFETEMIDPGEVGEHWVLKLQKKEVSVTPEELERPAVDEPRELEAMQEQIRQLKREVLMALGRSPSP